jgi:hypothetical protein
MEYLCFTNLPEGVPVHLKVKRLGEGGTQTFDEYMIPYFRFQHKICYYYSFVSNLRTRCIPARDLSPETTQKEVSPNRDSNPDLGLRRASLYPLSYWGKRPRL